MIRRFNYTGRRRIPRDCVAVALRDGGNGLRHVDARFELDDLRLPPEARLFLEAYHRRSFMRFQYGTVASPVPPPDVRLTEIPDPRAVSFRLKVVDIGGAAHRLLAVADRIRPRLGEDKQGARVPLLEVEIDDIGDAVWRLDFPPGGDPVLVVNGQIDGIREIAQRDGQFQATVFPAVLKDVLLHILVVEGDSEPVPDDADWRSNWLRFVDGFHDEAPPRRGGDVADLRPQLDWIDAAVSAFCRRLRAREVFQDARESGGGHE